MAVTNCGKLGQPRMIGGGPIAVARAAIYAHGKADLRDLNAAGIGGSAAAAIVEMEGPPESLVHLPAAYLDEILLRDRKRDAEERMVRIQARFAEALSQLDSHPESALGPINLFASIDHAEAFAHIETRLNATFRAETGCRPRRRLGYVLEAGFWAYWNWALIQLDLQADAIRPLLVNIQHQFEFYAVRGLHMRDVGEAVRHAMAVGAGERLRLEQAEGARERLWAARPATDLRVDPQLKTGMDHRIADHLFEQTAERFRGLYASEKNPTIGNELGMALEMMIDALGYKHDLADPASNDLWSLGSAGYAWRVAEGGGTGHAKEEIKEAVAADFEPGHDRPYALMHAASGILKRGAPIGRDSPGGVLHGRMFLRRGCEHAIEFIENPAANVAPDHQEAAFYFGVALHDVERFVDEFRADEGR